MPSSQFATPFYWFHKRYTRATDIFLDSWEISAYEVMTRIGDDRRRFEKFKFCVKFLFLFLFSATTKDIQDKLLCREKTASAGRFFEEAHWSYCPKLDTIAKKYYTDVKYFPPKMFETFL